jgi:hypothetical protein
MVKGLMIEGCGLRVAGYSAEAGFPLRCNKLRVWYRVLGNGYWLLGIGGF